MLDSAGNALANVITGNTGPGVRVGTTTAGSNINSGYVRITQNWISGNTGLGIDLDNTVGAPRDGDGITVNDGATDGDGGSNNLQNFPTATSFSTDGTDLTVSGLTIPGPGANSYRLEFFASAAADPSGNGEGTRYLGSRDVLGGATFNGTLAGFNVAAGEYVTMTATRTDALVPTQFFETSEFSAAYLAAGAFDISGTIYEDVDGDSVDGAAPADWVGRDNVRVRLFRDGGDGFANGADDTFVTSTLTGPGGTYTFANQAAGTYWVVVDSRTVTPSTGTSIANQVWAEQTYGTAGAWGAASPRPASSRPPRALRGRSAATSDNSSDAPDRCNSDHVTRVGRGERRHRRRLGVQLQRRDQRARRRRRRRGQRRQPAAAAGLAAPVHPERQRHGRRERDGLRAGGERQRRRRRRPGQRQRLLAHQRHHRAAADHRRERREHHD
jgi:hypothetical protein